MESLTPVSDQAPIADRALGVGAAGDALVGGDRDRGRRRELGRLLELATGCSASSISSCSSSASVRFAVSTSQAPLASTRIRASGPSASRTARTWPTSSPAPSFSLKEEKPPPPRRAASAATSPGSPATRVALQRTGGGGGPAAAPCSASARLPRRSASAVSAAQRAGAESASRIAGERLLIEAVALAEPLELGDHLGQAGSAAQRQRHRFAEPDDALLVAQPQQHHLAPLEAAPRGHVRLAKGSA